MPLWLGYQRTMTPHQQAAQRAKAAYHAAADTYDHPALSFWDRFGRETVAQLNLPRGAKVLDVCCGSGASALPAAEAVGPGGRVLGVDLAPGLIELASAKAKKHGLNQAEFLAADFFELNEPAATFDAVVCVFGIFFMPDMPAAVRKLWHYVKPGGQIAITTWGPRVFEPANSVFWETIRAVRPELYKGFNPWDRISEPDAVVKLFAEGGVTSATAVARSGWHPISSVADWWAIVRGSGYRGIVEQLTEAEHAKVQTAVTGHPTLQGLREIETNVVFARAVKG